MQTSVCQGKDIGYGDCVMADLLENLNERQQEAVLETEGYVRVIAGAGSGKTKFLVSRYAYLVQDYGIDPANILCVTFTNKAAGEMKKRIPERLEMLPERQ